MTERAVPEKTKTKTKKSLPLAVTNAATANFQCVFPKCGGTCCRGSRPPVEPGEARLIAKILPRVIDRLRPSARRSIEKRGFLTKRIKSDRQMLSVQDSYCVFYNEGCELYRLGALEGDTTKYKPWVCTAFPLDTDAKGNWEVRQWGNKGEAWDLFCLNPKESKKKAVTTLGLELDFVASLETPKQRWRFKK